VSTPIVVDVQSSLGEQQQPCNLASN